MNSISWDDQRIFLAVLETGSLSAAARRLNVTHPTVRARIAILEAAVGVPLFTRSQNGLVPTNAALQVKEAAKAMEIASDLFLRRVRSSSTQIEGTLRISVPEVVGVEIMPRILRRLSDQHPGLRIEMSLSNQVANVLAQEVDIAIRTVTPEQGALIARKVSTRRLGLFASHDYVAQHGLPAHYSDLMRHKIIGPDRNRFDLSMVAALGQAFERQHYALCCDSHPAQLAAARKGVGIAVVQVPIGASDKSLVRILPELDLGGLDVWLVTHENLAQVPRIRAVLDLLAEEFRADDRAMT